MINGETPWWHIALNVRFGRADRVTTSEDHPGQVMIMSGERGGAPGGGGHVSFEVRAILYSGADVLGLS
jgi:hypothetical protein